MSEAAATPWWRRRDRAARLLLAELFAAGNLAFLAVDISIAHSVNSFAHPLEWLPFVFSVVAPLLLLPDLLGGAPTRGAGRSRGLAVGAASVVVGILGLILHLESSFFEEQTLHHLVYTAPFAAPLAYAGVGLLLILNRTADAGRPIWGRWVVLLGLGGFVGNLALALCDHAQNGFFEASEWIPVGAAAYAVAALAVALAFPVGAGFLRLCLALMGAECLVGLAGAWLHGEAVLADRTGGLLDAVVHGAPVFAPLLFVDLALLTALGLWDVLADDEPDPS